MGGVGKSTMINEVHTQAFKQGMFEEVAVVEVKAEAAITRIQEEIACALGLTITEKSVAERARQLTSRLLKLKTKQQVKKKKKVLIILDDLVDKLDLQVVGIPSSNDKVQIKLLLTSRDKNLLSDKMGVRHPIYLGVFDDAAASKMFKKIVGKEDEAEGTETYRVAELVAKGCGGLPVVIKAIANALKDKDVKEWEETSQRLDVRDALSNLEVSYQYLPNEESKNLFLICGIIRGQRTLVKDLLKYTFGLGLYEEKDIHTLTGAAAELEKLLSGLEAASMLLTSDDDDGRYVRIHDRMRDLAIKIVKRDRHEWAHFTLRNYRRKLPRRFDASKLELLLSYCEGDSLHVPDLFFKDMNKLYVLEFRNLYGALPPATTTTSQLDLGNLETLCLHHCSLSDISMIGELKGLQILSFRGSDIRKLPIQLKQLTALKMLDLSDCKYLTRIVPDVLGSLVNLEELNMESSFKDWEIEGISDQAPSNARLIELKKMSHLSNLRVHIPSTSMLPKDDHQLFSSKLTLHKIILGDVWNWDTDAGRNDQSRALMLQFDGWSDIIQQDWVQATLQSTQFLYLCGRLDGKCESISELCVKGFECLKHLQVRDCPSIRYIVSSSSGSNSVRNLETLFVENLKNLEKLCYGFSGQDDESTFSKLKAAEVKHCNKLKHLFDFSSLKGCSSHLETIIVMNCSEIKCVVDDQNDKNEDFIALLKLQELTLQRLPNFSSFCLSHKGQNNDEDVIDDH